MIKQSRSFTALFALFEKWGAIGAVLYFIFGLSARWYNSKQFNKQVTPPRGQSCSDRAELTWTFIPA